MDYGGLVVREGRPQDYGLRGVRLVMGWRSAATVREALQTSPSSDEVRVVVLRRDPQATNPTDRTAPIYTATFARRHVEQVRPDRVDLDTLLVQVPDAQLTRKGATGEIVAIDTSDDPDLARLTAQFADALVAS